MLEENAIILCVIPANQDITNDEALHMARQIDVKGERTIGCLTKIDIMDRGTDARASLMNKGEVPLKLGYVGIRNRSQADINDKKTVFYNLIRRYNNLLGMKRCSFRRAPFTHLCRQILWVHPLWFKE
jgi:replication fork clamp-binding protein CrfC